MISLQTPLKMFQKIPQKFHDKTVQSNMLWLNLNKIDEIIFFYNQHINKVTPHFTFMRRAQNADTRAHKQHRLSQNISPVGFSFVLVIASDMHLEHESDYNSYIDLRPIYCSLTCSHTSTFFLGNKTPFCDT